MANALIGGLIQQGFTPEHIGVIEPNPENRAQLAARYGVTVYASAEAADWAVSVVVLAVKPQQMREAVQPLLGQLKQQLVISIAAGLRLDTLSQWLGGYSKIVRTMPNTPALISTGITGLCAAPSVSFTEREMAERILQAVGSTVWVENEPQIDGITALSGSGPAYVFLFIEAMQQAAAELGFTPEQARQLSIETVLGAAKLAAQSDEAASVLRERVTSKGGTTEAALKVMADTGVKAGIIAGVHAAAVRGKELGDILGAA